MLYNLFIYLDKMNVPGAGVFYYISFRSAMAIITSLIISLMYGKKIITYLRRKQIGESIRDLGLDGQMVKKGTPTMGGVIIIASILIPVLLFCNLANVYIQLMILTTIWLGLVGFLDDYIKVFKKNKEGIKAKVKLAGQIILGIIIGLTLWLNDDAVVREKVLNPDGSPKTEIVVNSTTGLKETRIVTQDVKSTKTTIPFVKNNELDYSDLLAFLGKRGEKLGWFIVILVIIFVVTFISNGANITDGIDGLATGITTIQATTLGILAYVSGNLIFAKYLNIMYIPNSGELVIFISAVIGATIGFLWYNSYPAQVFMGDTGSLALGGIIAVYAIIIRKELLIPILSGIFVIENLSVMIQVAYFKYTKKKYGEGRRVFKMAPLHHHYQKLNYAEPKIVTRFWIVGVLLAVITIVTLKIR